MLVLLGMNSGKVPWFELNIVKWFVKTLKAMGEHLLWLGAVPINSEKFTSLDAVKMHLWMLFALN